MNRTGLFQRSQMAFVDEFVVQNLQTLCLVRNYNLSKIQLGCNPSPSPYSREIFCEGPRRATQHTVLTEFLQYLHVCRLAVIQQANRYLDDFRQYSTCRYVWGFMSCTRKYDSLVPKSKRSYLGYITLLQLSVHQSHSVPDYPKR